MGVRAMIHDVLYTIVKWLARICHYIYPYRLAVVQKRVVDQFYNAWISKSFVNFGASSQICRPCTLVGERYISIGKNVKIDHHSVLTAWDNYAGDTFSPNIEIGNDVQIGEYVHITAINSIKIGRGTLTGRWVTITDNSHGDTGVDTLHIQPTQRKLYSKGPVVIGNNVWIGDKVTILPGITISDGAVIGANAVVNKDIPPYSLAVGNPIKIVSL